MPKHAAPTPPPGSKPIGNPDHSKRDKSAPPVIGQPGPGGGKHSK